MRSKKSSKIVKLSFMYHASNPKSEDLVEKVELEFEKIRLGGSFEEGIRNIIDLVIIWSSNFKELQEQNFLETNFLLDTKDDSMKEEDEITKIIMNEHKKRNSGKEKTNETDFFDFDEDLF